MLPGLIKGHENKNYKSIRCAPWKGTLQLFPPPPILVPIKHNQRVENK